MSAFGWACQKTLYAVLTGASPALCDGRVYDAVPQDVAFPYVEIGTGQTIPDDSSTADGGEDAGVSDFFDLHVWSRSQGQKEAREIVDVIHGLLHQQSLAIAGRASANSWVRTIRHLTDPDGVTRHAVVSVEIIHRS
jgi:hypothetical protein